MAGLMNELKRRNVFKVGIAYLVAAWLLMQITDVVAPLLSVPDWVPRFIFLLLAIGFVPALIFAWAYELTPDGIRRESEVDRAKSIRSLTGRRLDRLIIAMMTLAIIYLVLDNYVFEDAPAPLAEVALEKSIAVLPFRNRSDSDADTHFVDGIHDDILTQLTKLSTLDKVISRTSTERYRDTELPIPQIADELGVATILEGGVQRAGNNVRINVQLIEAATDEHLWAEIYDRELTVENLFAIQSEISREVVVALHGVLSDEESERLEQNPTTSFEAYQEYAFGRQELAKRTGDSLRRARTHFETAIELDPNYALAWAALADVQALPQYFGELPETSYAQAEASIERALEINPLLGEAYATRGFIKGIKRTQRDFEDAEEDLRKAIELSPNYATSYHRYSNLLQWMDRHDEAADYIRRAIELDPLSPILRASQIFNLLNQGKVQEAKAASLEEIRRNPEFPNFYGIMANALYEEGQVADSLRWLRAGLELNRESTIGRSQECGSFLHMLDDDAAEDCVDALEAEVPGAFPVRVFLYEIRGEWDESAAYARRLLEEGASQGFQIHLLGAVFASGEWAYVREWLEQSNPEYFGETDWSPTGGNDLLGSTMAATIMYDAGEVGRANYIFEQLDAGMRADPRFGPDGDPFISAWISYVRGEKRATIATLRERAAEGGVGWAWRFDAPYWENMKGEPGWAELVDDIKAEMRRQREWYEANKDDPLF
jgi:TolB-like protein